MNKSVIPSAELQIPMPNARSSANSADVQEISVEFDQANGTVTVTPQVVHKGATVRFKDPKGGRLRIAFLSPSGSETESVLDTESVAMKTGGTYHFKCYFAQPEAKTEIVAEHGAVIDVRPHLP